ncbi:uncharacterized protein LOC115218089 [Octopus sinensis]|uniref:Uncharacterized protein LOC115218089 n=1 Tax=Octopus sinensis TaxID=2607531 RepID=A0A6P7T161_9MOLL|nr:uncharacterized protein LOC115218089 [Octopus sinensis]
MACQSGQRLLMVLLLTILTSFVTAAPVTEESNVTEVAEVRFEDIEKVLADPFTELSELLKELDDESVQSNKTHHHLLRSSADILTEIRANILKFLNDHFPDSVNKEHPLMVNLSCHLRTEEYEHATLAELCQKFSGGTISYTVKADVDCILSSLFRINSYLQKLISFYGLTDLKKTAELSKMLNSLAGHFQTSKEDVTEKMEASCQNYTAALAASKIGIANGIGVNETSNNTEVADRASVNQNTSAVDGIILSEEDKKKKQEENFEEEKKTIGEIKNNVHLLSGLLAEFEKEEKAAESLAGLAESNVTISSDIDAMIANVNAEKPNATLSVGSSVVNSTESKVVNTDEIKADGIVESNDTLSQGSRVNLTESNVVNTDEIKVGEIVESNDTLSQGSRVNLTESNVVNTDEIKVGEIVESNDTLSQGSRVNPTESNVVNTDEIKADGIVESNDTLSQGSRVNPTESNVVNTDEIKVGGIVESNDTLSQGSRVNPTESNVVNADEIEAGGIVESNDTLSQGSRVNPTESNVVNTDEVKDSGIVESNVVSTLKPHVTEAGDNVEKTDNDESMLKILKSETGMANNATIESEESVIDGVKESLENKEALHTTKGTPKENDLEEIFNKLF